MFPARHRNTLLASIAAAALSANTAAQCPLVWDQSFVPSDFNNAVQALWVHDGGQGPRLYAGGSFTTAGTSTVNRIAIWDGAKWSQVGLGFDDGEVRALASYDPDGSGPLPNRLIAGGFFHAAGGAAVNFIAAWDGTTWSQIGPTRARPVDTVLVTPTDPPMLVVGGSTTGGDPAVAIWNEASQNWTGLGSLGSVRDLAWFDVDGDGPLPATLIAATVNAVSRWDEGSASWMQMGAAFTAPSPLSPNLRTLAVLDRDGPGPLPTRLYVCGTFTSKVAEWSGTAWAALPTNPVFGSSTTVEAITTFDDDGPGPDPTSLYVGNGQSLWRYEPLNSPQTGWVNLSASANRSINAFAIFDEDGAGPRLPSLIAAGFPPATYIANVVRWNAASRITERFDWPGINYVTSMFAWDPDGAGPERAGVIVSAQDIQPYAPVIYRDGRFSTIGAQYTFNTTLSTAYTWATFDPDGPGPQPESLYMGGYFQDGTPLEGIARFDGAAWQSVGGGLTACFNNTGTPFSMVVWDEDGPGPGQPMLWVGGSFRTAGQLMHHSLAAWDGAAWNAPAVPFSATGCEAYGITQIIAFDDDHDGRESLFVWGTLETSPISLDRVYMARYDGAGWRDIGGGIFTSTDYSVRLVVLDPDGSGPFERSLYAIVGYTPPSPLGATSFYRWDASAGWIALPQPAGLFPFSTVYFTTVVDIDGPGPHGDRVIISVQPSGGGASYPVGAWDGEHWTVVANPDSPAQSIAALVEPGSTTGVPSVFLAGGFTSVDGVPSSHFARGHPGLPSFVQHPAGQTVSWGGTIRLTAQIGAAALSGLNLQWTREGAPLADSERMHGSRTPVLEITGAAAADSGAYRLVAVTPCGMAQTIAAMVSVNQPACPADSDGSGQVTLQDLFDFLAFFFASDPRADVNGEDGVSVQDVFTYLEHFFGNC